MDRDLAALYDVETSQLNRQVKRNIQRFPEDFMFQLTKEEVESLKCQNGISNTRGGDRYLPYVFTEQGVSMLSGLLRSETAIQANILIMRAFVSMRRFLVANAQIFQRLDRLDRKQLENEQKFEKVFAKFEENEPRRQGIFYASFWSLRVKILRRSLCLFLSVALAKSLNDWRLTSVNI